jgi:hypothetical protein
MTGDRARRSWRVWRVWRRASVALGLAATSLAFLPLAVAADSEVALKPAVEAWYQPDPSCTLPTGCVTGVAPPVSSPTPPPEPAVSPYPAGSLHVATEAGTERARSYLSFTLPSVEARLTGATLEVPVDASPQSGTVAPEEARIVVCAFGGSLQRTEGSLAAPPTTDCTASAQAKYSATPAPRLVADLAPLLLQVAAGAGLALVPDATAMAPDDTWHVAFSMHDREDAAAPPPATLRLALGGANEEPIDSEPPASPAPVLGAPVTTPPLEVAQAEPLPPAAAGAPAPTVVAPPPFVAAPQASTVTVGYAYPTVWLLPLVLLVVIPLVGSTLTMDMSPVGRGRPRG